MGGGIGYGNGKKCMDKVTGIGKFCAAKVSFEPFLALWAKCSLDAPSFSMEPKFVPTLLGSPKMGYKRANQRLLSGVLDPRTVFSSAYAVPLFSGGQLLYIVPGLIILRWRHSPYPVWPHAPPVLRSSTFPRLFQNSLTLVSTRRGIQLRLQGQGKGYSVRTLL